MRYQQREPHCLRTHHPPSSNNASAEGLKKQEPVKPPPPPGSLSGFGLSSIATNCVSLVLRVGFRAGRKHKNTSNQCITTPHSRKSDSLVVVNKRFPRRPTSSGTFASWPTAYQHISLKSHSLFPPIEAWPTPRHPPSLPSTMTPQPQVQRVRPEVVLVAQVGLVVFADKVVEQGDGHDKGHIRGPVGLDEFQRLLLFVG